MSAKRKTPKTRTAKAAQTNIIDDPWHFARTDLAVLFLDRFKEAGARNGVDFFAPRRRGKTQFLLLDLAPEAVRRGYTVVYASLWDDMNRPQQAILSALERAHKAKKGRRNKLTGSLGGALKSLKARAAFKGFEVSAEMEVAKNPVTATSEELQRINTLVNELAGKKGRNNLLMMIDEIQHLATRTEFHAVAGKLKTLTETVAGMDLVITGSSRSGLSHLFGDRMPLQNVTRHEAFPDLNDDFVHHMAKTYRFVTGKRFADMDGLLKLFEDVDRSPFYLRGIIEAMIVQRDLSMDDAHERMMDAVSLSGRYEERWYDLKPIDRLVLLKILKKETLYDEKALKEFKTALYGDSRNKTVTRGLVQSSVRRLSELQYISPRMGARGRYNIEMLGFGDWIDRNEDGLFEA